MIYTVIYQDEIGTMDTLTFVSERHSKDCAWTEFVEDHAVKGQTPIAIMPGNQVVYFPQDISFTQVA